MSIDLNRMPKLGLGLMRLPKKDDQVDMAQVCQMVDDCMAAGLNYFDTAYVYHSGKSEEIAREALVKRYPRESFFLADKLPAWCMKDESDRDRIFNEQLERCGVDYFDFYLLHSVEDGSNGHVYEKMDCYNWALEKKAQGKIRHFGFSFHDGPEYLEKTLDAHPEVEFVQIQLNYADWENPLVCSGQLHSLLRQRNIPMIVMEPVKGGMLAQLTPELEEKFKAMHPDKSIASWALRFAASQSGVMTVLSGMSDCSQVADNISTFSHFEPITPEEQAVINEVTRIMLDAPLVGCTACRYCTDGCPMNIAIPDVLKALNTIRLYKEVSRPKFFYENLVDNGSGKAGSCIGCKRCQQVCPQHLPIVELLKEASASLDT